MNSKWSKIVSTFLIAYGVLILSPAGTAEAKPVRVGHVEVELVSERTSIMPGEPFQVALRLSMDEDWHVYWRNPGDAGLPPTITWHLPDKFIADEIEWPTPEVIDAPPSLSFGYHGELLLPVRITPPKNLASGQELELTADIFWLVCEKVCVPGETKLSLTLPVRAETASPNSKWAAKFEATRANSPVPADGWQMAYLADDEWLYLDLMPPSTFADGLSEVRFLSHVKGLLDDHVWQEVNMTGEAVRLKIRRSKYGLDIPELLKGILITSGGAVAVSARPADQEASSNHDNVATTTGGSAGSLWWALVLAFAGGIILNLMPCVLPVLSLKILAFVNQAGEDRKKIFGHGVLFTVGVLVSFWILAGSLIALQAGGEQLGWGFQLQSPVFLVILSGFMFLFGLSLLGVFEVGSSLTGVGGAARKGGGFGSFLNGVTATVVATPCTAPFMGSALGYSLSQPAWASLLIFSFLGLGMAAPYLLLSGFPGLLRFVPKPGRWMETMKQVMGFLLLGTVVWLGWVLSLQVGGSGLVVLLITLLVLGIGGWVIGRWGSLSAKPLSRRLAYVVASALIVIGMAGGLKGVSLIAVEPVGNLLSSDGLIKWERYSAERLSQLRVSGQPVFIDFTAAWCVSCQVNERLAFGSEKVQRSFVAHDVAALKADWTSRDENITRALADFGRNSVPLYVLYGRNSEAIILPEILTPGIVLNALETIDDGFADGSPATLSTLAGEHKGDR